MAKQYKLELKRGYPQDTHHRAGLVLHRGGALVTELTDDQLEAVKNDSYIEINEASEGEQSQAAPTSEEQGAGVADTSADGADAPDRSASEDTQADEDQAAESEEEAAGEAAGAEEQSVEENQSAPAGDAAEPAAEAAEDQALAQSTADQVAQEGAENASEQASEDAAPTVDDLVRDNDRPTLDKMAAEAGVVDADKMQNKVEVATAILEKRA